MSTTPEDLFEVAAAIATLGAELDESAREACWRSAVSRYYYAAFAKAHAFAYDDGYRFRQCPKEFNLRPDEALWTWWFTHEGSDMELSVLGDCLHGLRNMADYKPKGHFTEAKVEKARALAQAILDRVNGK